jgi:transcriptional regulator with XRE-family HTH domain
MVESSIYQLLSPADLLTAADTLCVEVGRRIRDRRHALGLTQSELAAPLTKSYLSAVENGRVMPSLRVLWYLADRLGVGVGDLVDTVKPGLTVEYNRADVRTGASQRPGPPQDRRRPA